jgi:hypothetical protein
MPAVLDFAGALIIVAGSGAIGVLMIGAYRERIKSRHRAYEAEMAEHRDLYVALARQRRTADRTPDDAGLPVR